MGREGVCLFLSGSGKNSSNAKEAEGTQMGCAINFLLRFPPWLGGVVQDQRLPVALQWHNTGQVCGTASRRDNGN